MMTEMLFKKFELFADTPNAVAQMRNLVLELAMQGKLVGQIPAEGDGHSLLKQIYAKNSPSDAESETDLSTDTEAPVYPRSWAYGRLGEVTEIIRGVTFPGSAKSETRSNGDVACLRTASVQAEIDWDDLIYISPDHVSRPDQWVAPNDVIISMANSYALVGKVAIIRSVPQKATFGAFLAAIRPILIEPYFLLYALRSPRMQAAFRASSSQTTNIANISLGRMRPLPFPLPPIAEQRRIVAKVDELMALCDRLEAQQNERAEKHASLARASLARFAEAPTPANLKFLFHNAYTIPPTDLRKLILTLAVLGKLVASDSSGWKTATLDAVAAEIVDCPHSTPKWTPAGKICVRTNQFRPGQLDLSGSRFVSNETFAERVVRLQPQQDDILYSREGGILGVACRVPPGAEICLGQRMMLIRAGSNVTPRFLELLLNSPIITDIARRETIGGAAPRINVATVKAYPISYPPLAEQRRIVEKVDQLMALVDQLEVKLAAAHTLGTQLTQAIVAELTSNAPQAVDTSLVIIQKAGS